MKQCGEVERTSSSSCCFESSAIFSISRSSFSSALRRCKFRISRSLDAESERRRWTSAPSRSRAVVAVASPAPVECRLLSSWSSDLAK